MEIGDLSSLEALLAGPHDRVVLDLGCGDARATARLAAQEPRALVIGVDANLDAAARVLKRSRRATEKGGLSNLVLIRAAADRLPPELHGAVDELRIELPWGSLLDGLLTGDATLLEGIAAALAPGGRLRIVANARALPAELTSQQAAGRLDRALASVALTARWTQVTAVAPTTGWGKRLSGRRPLTVIVAEASKTSL